MESLAMTPLVICLLMLIIVLGGAEKLQIGVLTSTEDHSWNKSVKIRPSLWSGEQLTITYIPVQVPDSVNVIKAWISVCSLISSGVRIYLSTLPCDQPHVIQRAIESKLLSHDLPMIQLKSCDLDCKDLCIAVSTTQRDILDIIISIAAHQQWQEVAIIYDALTSQNLNLMLEEFSKRGLSVILLSIEDLVNTHNIRWQLQHVTGFVVMTTDEHQVHYVLKQARLGYLDLLGPSFQWVLICGQNWNISTMMYLLEEGDNVAMVTTSEGEQTNSSSLVSLVESALYDITANHSEYWTTNNISCSTNYTWTFGKHFAYQYRNVLLNSILSSYNVLSLRRESAEELGFVSVAEYSQTKGLILTYHALFPQLFEGFNNRTFLITTTHSPPFTIDLRNGSWGGIVFDLVNELAQTLNFSYTILPADSFGIENKGVHTGMMGLIQKKEVDFGAATFTMTSSRDRVADFTTPFWVDPSLLLMKKPSLIRAQLFVCFDPFTLYVWIILAISVTVVGAVIWGFNTVDPTLPKILRVRRCINKLDLNLWQAFGALFQQGMVHDPESHSARMVTSFWWLFTIVIVGTYNGNLIAYLTSPRINVPVNNLQDLSESSLKFGFVSETSTHQMFANSSSGSIYHQLWTRISNNPDSFIMDASEDGIHRVLNDESYVFLCDKSFYDTIAISSPNLDDKKCDIVRSEDEFLKNMYALAFPQDSPYTQQFSMSILHLLEAGLFERWRHKWYGVDNRCTGLERSIAQTNIGFGESQGAFYVLVMGLVLSVVFFLGEKFLQLRRQQLPPGGSSNHKNTVARESKTKASNGISLCRKNGSINSAVSTEVGDTQLHSTDTSLTTLSELDKNISLDVDNSTNNTFSLSGVYSKVFSTPNIDSLPSTSSVHDPKTYHGEFGEPRSIFNSRFSSTSEYGSPIHDTVTEVETVQHEHKSVYYTLTSECTQL